MCIDVLYAIRDRLPEEFSIQQATMALKPVISGKILPTTHQLAQQFRISKLITECGIVKEGPGKRKVYKFVE